MSIQEFFIVWKDIGLILYAILKAFLPLPSLEVVLVPITLANPANWLLYSLEGAVGTFIGGGIGYWLAHRYGRRALSHMASQNDIDKGEELMNRYGVWAVFIGGITPIPDFLLAYLAGFTHMRFSLFAFCDAFARLLRSLLVCYGLLKLGEIINVDWFGTVFSLVILAWLLFRWGKEKWRLHQQDDK